MKKYKLTKKEIQTYSNLKEANEWLDCCTNLYINKVKFFEHKLKLKHKISKNTKWKIDKNILIVEKK